MAEFPATGDEAIQGEGGGGPLIDEGQPIPDFILPEFTPVTPPAPTPRPIDTCPGIECCDPNPFAYTVPRPAPTMVISMTGGGDITCSTCFGNSYSAHITASGIGPRLTWTVTAGALPTGLVFHGGQNNLGYVVIDGVPMQSGTFTITVQAQDPVGNTLTDIFTVTVVAITTTSLPNYIVGQFYYAALQVTGGSGHYFYHITSGSLPDGLFLDQNTGVISGTPTGNTSGSGDIEFEVIDVDCEKADPNFVPEITGLVASSVTKIATVLGYNSYLPFLPPKRYHTATWTGHSEQQLWYNGIQVGGARYDYSGFSNIDGQGNIVTTHVKEYSAMCNGDPSQSFGEIYGTTAFSTVINPIQYPFKGYFGIAGPRQGTPLPGSPANGFLCTSSNIPYADVGNQAQNQRLPGLNDTWTGSIDQSDFWGTAPLRSATYDSNDLKISNFAPISPDGTVAGDISTGADNVPILQYVPRQFGIYYNNNAGGLPVPPLPPDWVVLGTIIYDNNYTCTLSNEYTDVEALANAQVINGASRTAENIPRTGGFVSRFTDVSFDISCGNLILGQIYIVTVDFLDLPNQTQFSTDYPIIATSSNMVVHQSIPQPPSGKTLTVANPRIRLGP
jgi:hypothetical protein